jgi:hypothetical protein
VQNKTNFTSATKSTALRPSNFVPLHAPQEELSNGTIFIRLRPSNFAPLHAPQEELLNGTIFINVRSWVQTLVHRKYKKSVSPKFLSIKLKVFSLQRKCCKFQKKFSNPISFSEKLKNEKCKPIHFFLCFV